MLTNVLGAQVKEIKKSKFCIKSNKFYTFKSLTTQVLKNNFYTF